MKFGVIGTSWITDSFIEAAHKVEGVQLTSVYSRSEGQASAFARKHGAGHVFTDLEGMAESDALDFIYIASPNSLHAEHAMIFLQQKKHVVCEKPIFSNLSEWNRAHEIADKHGVYLFEAFRNLHTPNFGVVRDHLKDVGRVRSMILNMVQYSSRYTKFLAGERPNIFTAEYSGGALVDLGVYPISTTVALFGKPNQVSYFPVMLESGVDGGGTLVLTYDNFVSTIVCSKISNSYQACEIHGEDGTLIFDGPGELDNAKLINRESQQEIILGTKTYENNMHFEIARFKHIIENNDRTEYERLKDISETVLSITEKARNDNGIVFGTEKN